MKENILNANLSNETTLPIQAVILPTLLPIQATILPVLLTIQAMKLPASPTPPPQNQMILMSMASIYLLYLPLVFVYFWHITLPQPKKRLLNGKAD